MRCSTIMEPDNSERYDRQIRLWGQHGQEKCSNSKICLINADSLGTEILKGLCLAGIGSFTIIDSHKLTPEDVGCSFVPHSCVGKNRGESVKQMMLDLNEEVGGETYPMESHLPHVVSEITNPEAETGEATNNNLVFWRQFNCVIACGLLYNDQIVRLGKLCWTIGIPLILCKSIGFFGTFRTQLRDHLVIETHPENRLPDFYLDCPFRDLREYLDSVNFDDESSIDKAGRYPYIVIIYKYLKIWRTQNNFSDNRLPKSFPEKKQLRSIIDEGVKDIMKRRKAIKGYDSTSVEENPPLENFLEASKAVNTCLASCSGSLPESVLTLFEHLRRVEDSNHNLDRFWIIVKAVKEFVYHKNNGRLPVPGTIPDMISSSDEYIRLQTIYSRKAKEDIDGVLALAQNLIANSQTSASLYDEIKLICKNFQDIQVLSTGKIHHEYSRKAISIREDHDEDEFVTIDLCLRALNLFFSTYGRLPGYQQDQVEVDVGKLKGCVKQIVGKTSNRLRTIDQCLYELCRCGGAELHATSAFLGGCIAQEVIKLITNQYVPVQDTLVYNAMTASTKTFKSSEIFLDA